MGARVESRHIPQPRARTYASVCEQPGEPTRAAPPIPADGLSPAGSRLCGGPTMLAWVITTNAGR
jgi:hypothetical protein